jgi:hypothetical protein
MGMTKIYSSIRNIPAAIANTWREDRFTFWLWTAIAVLLTTIMVLIVLIAIYGDGSASVQLCGGYMSGQVWIPVYCPVPTGK